MAFIVTARKWRPQIFNDVVGQEHISSTLKNAIKNNRIAHAYIFTGPRGVGKTTTARILAKTLNCLNPIDNEPCNECELCNSIQNNQSMDIIEIDGASNRGIDEIRTLRESVKYAPTKGKYKVYIIDEVHMLTKESFNAFLKTLEEPPAHTIFIFATTDIHKVPLTIISRCQRFDFRRIQLNTIKSLLGKIAEAEKIEIDDKTLTIIAKKADGALRDAESYFDQIVSFCGNKIEFDTVTQMLNLIDDDLYFKVSDAVLNKNFNMVFELSDIIYDHGYDFTEFMNGLVEHFRNIMSVVITGKTNFLETAEIFREKYLLYKEKFSQGDLLRILNFLNKTIQEMRFSQNHRLKIEISLSHLIGLEKTQTISEIIKNLNSSDFSTTEQEKKSPDLKNDIITSNKNTTPVENVEPIQISPSLESSSKSDETLNFATIKKKWKEYVKTVSEEKKLILGSIIISTHPKSLEGNKLRVVLDNSDGIKEMTRQIKFLEKKGEEIFGKKLEFSFEKEASVKFINNQNESDPIVNFIKDHLSGDEIK